MGYHAFTAHVVLRGKPQAGYIREQTWTDELLTEPRELRRIENSLLRQTSTEYSPFDCASPDSRTSLHPTASKPITSATDRLGGQVTV